MTHAELLQRHLSNFGKERPDQDADVYASDLVTEFPYAPVDHTRRLEGPDALLAFQSRISTFAEAFSLSSPTLISEGDQFVARYHGSSKFKSTGLPYEQDYVVVVQVKDGKIAHIQEHYDPLRVLRAMGEIP